MWGSMPVNQQETQPQIQGCMHMEHPQHASNALTYGVENVQWQDQAGLTQLESNLMDTGRNSDVLHGTGGQVEGNREGTETIWQRIRWTDEMVKLLITAVDYIREYVNSTQQNKTPKKGKWRVISNVMVERGYIVSPQQCEDKFNDLNKKYKRLNEILGNRTASEVVENPSVMDSMNLSDKTVEEIIKILSSKQFFYQEMCSYHNGNRLFLPHDQGLEQSIQLALQSKDKNESREPIGETSAKRMRAGEDHGNGLNCNEQNDTRRLSTVGGEGESLPNEERIAFRLKQIEEQKLKIEEERLELEQKRLKWLRYSQHEDWKLEKMRLENKLMKLQNQQLAYELESQKKERKENVQQPVENPVAEADRDFGKAVNQF